MDRRYSCALLVAVVVASVSILGCHGGGTPVLAVFTTSLPNGTVNTPYSTTVEGAGGTQPYTWSQVSGGAMPPGLTFSAAGVIGGTPTKAGSFGPYVFKVVDANSDFAESGGMTIKIASNSLSVTTTTLPNGVVDVGYSTKLAASGGTPPYSWAVTSGGLLPPGLSLGSGGTISGTPTTAGSYGPYVFTVTDANSTTAQSGQLSITVTGTPVAACTSFGNEAALTSGTPYGFLLKGTDGTGNPIYIAGSFTPDGTGGITAAAADYNRFSDGPQSLQVNLANSSYAFGSSAQGCLYLAFSGLASATPSEKEPPADSHLVPAVATRTRKIKKPATVAVPVSSVQFSFYLSGFDGTVYNTGRIIESDNTSGTGTNAAGFIHVQTPADFALTALQTNYAFGVDGWASTASGVLRTAMAGTFTNTAGTLSAGFVDLDTGGTASGEQTGGYGTLMNTTIDTTTGRGTGSFFTTSTTGKLTYDFVFYILNGSDLILLSSDLASSSSTTPLLVGRALVSTAAYPATPLNGYYLLASHGLQTLGIAIGNIAEIGTLNATSTGAIPTATIYSNYAGTYATNQYPGSSYTVEAASGRTVLFNGSNLSSLPVVYLTASGADDGIAGFLVGTDAQSSSGVLVLQTAATPSFSTASVTGNYAASTAEDVDGSNGAFLGGFTFNGSGAYTLISSLVTGSLTNVPAAGSILINSDGSGNLQGGKFPLVTNGTVIFAIPNTGDPLLYVFTQGAIPTP
jgi:large repetitive protein